ncbi:uncharacterized protein LOC125315380 isoform X2 [Rhodamnia argentea]|uniref:Uncharacterized protein LOC125315380 isoform X2 n=1 Tax=Rhodamnia argentea TaxID=178133 RepID=A0ABM3HHA6_9MYRT|nr:uncharacterized protein LOC125315380 isoform X2 [Rhodamnia argentea]
MAETVVKERKILVAVDGGEESMYALSWCLSNLVSDNSRDTLVLLYAKPLRSAYSSLDGTGYLFSSDVVATMERCNNEMADCVMAKATKICEDFGEVEVETRVENGDARDVICRVAQKLVPDVLAMGSHGYALIKRAFLGERELSLHSECEVPCTNSEEAQIQQEQLKLNLRNWCSCGVLVLEFNHRNGYGGARPNYHQAAYIQAKSLSNKDEC